VPLAAGDKLGPFEILAPIGAGGMGEVYRAHDSRLNRDVAIKVANADFSERFSREARAIAALNHTNICHLYDVGPNYLVMEYVEGQNLRGPLDFDDALPIIHQLIDGIEAAHEKNIVHRDLKPANIQITPEGVVKILDFGLAKAMEPPPSQDGKPENSPTLTIGATQAGAILGTAAYMAPEQAKGKAADRRSDIWSFGVILYEVLTGRRLFTGETTIEILGAVLNQDPDISAAPARMHKLLHWCLEKDRKQRLASISDARRMLSADSSGADESTIAPVPSRFVSLPWIAAVAVLVAALGVALWAPWRAPAPPEVIKFEIFPPEKTAIGKFAVSPDGRKIVFYAESFGRGGLWVRSLDSVEWHLVANVPASGLPTFFWSYDSRFLAFPGGDNFSKLMKVDLTGAPPQTICEIKSVVVGGSWNRDGTIVFGSAAPGGLWRVSAAGGSATPLTVVDPSGQEQGHFSPVFLPDGKHFLYLRGSNVPENNGIYIGSLDAKPEQQGLKRLVATQFNPVIVPSLDPGAAVLLFLREDALLAQPLDLAKLEMTGDPVRVAVGLRSKREFGNFSASTTGVLAYQRGSIQEVSSSPLEWLDRAGQSLGTVGIEGLTLRLDPAAARVAVDRTDTTANEAVTNEDIWLYDFTRKAPTRLTTNPANEYDPVWSPDGAYVAYGSFRGNGSGLYQMPSNGSGGEATLLTPGLGIAELDDWSHDGRFLLYSEVNSKTKSDLSILPMVPEKAGEARKPIPYLNSEFNETEGQFSPNGHWIAYVSDESGREEVYIRPFPLSASGMGKVTVSTGGGVMPRWRRDGKELFFVTMGGDVMAMDVTDAPSLKVGIPKRLFSAPILNINPTYFTWDVAPDGKRFLVESSADQRKTAPSPITVVLNWQAGLKK
jgi:eukaryotic-like serine/threonine-protein kinase